jgi:hypothetical protein
MTGVLAMHETGMRVEDRADAFVERADGTIDLPGMQVDLAAWKFLELMVGGTFVVECYDADGRLRWRDTAKNGVTSVGLDYVLNTCFRGTTPITTWYLGLVDNAGWTGYNLTDTMASHSAPNTWAENTDYSNGSRPQWSPGAPSGNAISNGTTADFTMNPSSGTRTIKGLLCVSNNTVGGTSGTLFSTASFSGGTQTVNNGDTLKVTYTMSAANSASNS